MFKLGALFLFRNHSMDMPKFIMCVFFLVFSNVFIYVIFLFLFSYFNFYVKPVNGRVFLFSRKLCNESVFSLIFSNKKDVCLMKATANGANRELTG